MKQNFIYRALSTLVFGPLIIYIIYHGDFPYIALLGFLFLLGLYEIYKLNVFIIKFLILVSFLSFIYCLYKIRILENGNYYVFTIVLITWLSDIGGYIFGKLFRGPKIKIISPNKTYAGFIGSLLTVQFLIFFLNDLNINIHLSKTSNIFFLFSMSLIVILGDLTFSYFKRVCKIKDFSNIIPGHGGIFDRVDGMIFLTIFFYLYLIL